MGPLPWGATGLETLPSHILTLSLAGSQGNTQPEPEANAKVGVREDTLV